MATGTEGFWLFEGLEEEPYGLLPLTNLSAKGGATSTKSVERLGSYQWNLSDDDATILIPGMPNESGYWPGGRLANDRGILIYDVNHLKMRQGPLDPLILATKQLCETSKKAIDFDTFDFITDAINLQKFFAFAQEAGDGLFRIDCERVGKTVLLSRLLAFVFHRHTKLPSQLVLFRMEASDLMEIGHLTYDQTLKQKIAKPRSAHTSGPFFQIVSYQFGQFKFLVRYEVDCADYAAVKAPAIDPEKSELPSKCKFDLSDTLSYQRFGDIPKHLPLQLVTTYPQAAGFPFFTWAQMFFTVADQELVGFFKGNGDFNKPSLYRHADISKLMKPLPYAALSKVHDCLSKIRMFLLRNEPNFRFGLIWKGKAQLEIYSKNLDAGGAVSPAVRAYLATKCKEAEQNDSGDPNAIPPPLATNPLVNEN